PPKAIGGIVRGQGPRSTLRRTSNAPPDRLSQPRPAHFRRRTRSAAARSDCSYLRAAPHYPGLAANSSASIPLAHRAERLAQLARRSKQRVLHRFLGGSKQIADRPKPQPLIMLHLENHAFAGRKPLHRRRDLHAQFLPEQPLFRISHRARFRLAIKKVARAALAILRHRGLILAARGAAAKMIQSDVGYDSVEPGVEGALEAEAMQVPVDAQEAFLVDVPRLLGTANQIQRQPQDIPVVFAD